MTYDLSSRHSRKFDKSLTSIDQACALNLMKIIILNDLHIFTMLLLYNLRNKTHHSVFMPEKKKMFPYNNIYGKTRYNYILSSNLIYLFRI